MATKKNVIVSASTAKAIAADGAVAHKTAIERATPYQAVIDGLWADGIRFIHIMGKGKKDQPGHVEPIGALRDSIKASIKAGFPKDIQALMDKPAKQCSGPTRKDPQFKARINGAESERRQYWAQQPNSIMAAYAKDLAEKEGVKKAPSKGLDDKFAQAVKDYLADYQAVEGTIFDILIVQKNLNALKLHINETLSRIEAEKEQKRAARAARGKTAK